MKRQWNYKGSYYSALILLVLVCAFLLAYSVLGTSGKNSSPTVPASTATPLSTTTKSESKKLCMVWYGKNPSERIQNGPLTVGNLESHVTETGLYDGAIVKAGCPGEKNSLFTFATHDKFFLGETQQVDCYMEEEKDFDFDTSSIEGAFDPGKVYTCQRSEAPGGGVLE